MRENRSVSNLLDYYLIDGGKIVLSKEKEKALIEKHSYYASTPKEIEYYEVSKKLCDSVNEFAKWNIEKRLLTNANFIDFEFLRYNNNTKLYEIDGKMIRHRADQHS